MPANTRPAEHVSINSQEQQGEQLPPENSSPKSLPLFSSLPLIDSAVQFRTNMYTKSAILTVICHWDVVLNQKGKAEIIHQEQMIFCGYRAYLKKNNRGNGGFDFWKQKGSEKEWHNFGVCFAFLDLRLFFKGPEASQILNIYLFKCCLKKITPPISRGLVPDFSGADLGGFRS